VRKKIARIPINRKIAHFGEKEKRCIEFSQDLWVHICPD
jgi:hypothetical protein